MSATNAENLSFRRPALRFLLRSSIIAFLAATIAFAWSASPFAQALAGVAIAAAFVHASLIYGVKHALALFVICLVITFAIENIGVATGFPFGSYHFEVGAGLPHVGSTPLIVGPLWFGMGYFSWVVGGMLLDGADARSNEGGNVVALPLVAAFVMTQWDFVMDPPSSTIAKAWIWHDGGADFGVPLSNYFGWLLASWLYFQAWALYLSRHKRALLQARAQSRHFRLTAIPFCLAPGLTHVTPWLMGQNGEVMDGAGHVWRISELRERTVVVMLFTKFFSAALVGSTCWKYSPQARGAIARAIAAARAAIRASE